MLRVWEPDRFLEARSGVCVFRMPSVALQEERFRVPCTRKPLNGPSKTLLGTTQHTVLRSPFQGLCVQGTQKCPPILVAKLPLGAPGLHL